MHVNFSSTESSDTASEVSDTQHTSNQLVTPTAKNSKKSLLSRGLTFAPTTHFNLFNTILDVNKFARNVNVRGKFSAMDEESNNFTGDITSISQNLSANDVNIDFVPAMTNDFNFQELSAAACLQSLAAESVDTSDNHG